MHRRSYEDVRLFAPHHLHAMVEAVRIVPCAVAGVRVALLGIELAASILIRDDAPSERLNRLQAIAFMAPNTPATPCVDPQIRPILEWVADSAFHRNEVRAIAGVDIAFAFFALGGVVVSTPRQPCWINGNAFTFRPHRCLQPQITKPIRPQRLTGVTTQRSQPPM